MLHVQLGGGAGETPDRPVLGGSPRRFAVTPWASSGGGRTRLGPEGGRLLRPHRVVLLTPELSFRAWASGAMERPHVLAVRWKSGQVLEHVGSSRNWFPDYPGNIEDSALSGALSIEECTPCQSETRSTNCPHTGPIFSCASCC